MSKRGELAHVRWQVLGAWWPVSVRTLSCFETPAVQQLNWRHGSRQTRFDKLKQRRPYVRADRTPTDVDSYCRSVAVCVCAVWNI